MDNRFHTAWYLTGPTASGKTAVGVSLARLLGDIEILALDSMTVYRGMDIGTAKATVTERQGIPHHLLDMIDPWESASVAEYRAWAAEALEGIAARGHRALFVGGTPLYLKALLRGLFEGPSADPEIRARLKREAEALGNEALHRRLTECDPATAARLPVGDLRRIIRALEVWELTGRPISEFHAEHDRPAPATVKVAALERPREVVRERIDRRVEQMFAEGLVEEVRALRDDPRGFHPVPAQGVGYKEVIEYLDGRASLAEAVRTTQARTRQFAKRQGTWFRGLAEVTAWTVPDDESAGRTAERLAAWLGAGA